jgi:hypothetical protein
VAMRDDYKIKTTTAPLEVQIEAELTQKLVAMEKYTGHTVSELVNTAVKNFVSRHSDFLPPQSKK